MGSFYLVWRPGDDGDRTGRDEHPDALCRSDRVIDYRLELADRACRARTCLLLRALRFRVDHGPRHRDVHSISCCFSGDRRTCRTHGSYSRLLCQPERRINTLRHHARTRLLRPRLRNAETMVDGRTDRLELKYHQLVGSWFGLVEGARVVVMKK